MPLASASVTLKSLDKPYSVLPYARLKFRIFALRRSLLYLSFTNTMPSLKLGSMWSMATFPASMSFCTPEPFALQPLTTPERGHGFMLEVSSVLSSHAEFWRHHV